MKPVLALVAAIILTGCGKHADSTGNAAAPGDATAAQGANDLAGTLSDLTQALRKYSMENRRVPKTLDELTSKGYLSAVPPAPAGRKFAIDEKKVQVVIVNQ